MPYILSTVSVHSAHSISAKSKTVAHSEYVIILICLSVTFYCVTLVGYLRLKKHKTKWRESNEKYTPLLLNKDDLILGLNSVHTNETHKTDAIIAICAQTYEKETESKLKEGREKKEIVQSRNGRQ